jgi:uncharacterized membrane protein YecN with MAPEG domain
LGRENRTIADRKIPSQISVWLLGWEQSLSQKTAMTGFAWLLGVIYIIGALKFWSGFRSTNFIQNRLGLTIFWPILLISPSYRQNFRKALKG